MEYIPDLSRPAYARASVGLSSLVLGMSLLMLTSHALQAEVQPEQMVTNVTEVRLKHSDPITFIRLTPPVPVAADPASEPVAVAETAMEVPVPTIPVYHPFIFAMRQEDGVQALDIRMGETFVRVLTSENIRWLQDLPYFEFDGVRYNPVVLTMLPEAFDEATAAAKLQAGFRLEADTAATSEMTHFVEGLNLLYQQYGTALKANWEQAELERQRLSAINAAKELEAKQAPRVLRFWKKPKANTNVKEAN